jgi:hypothetical protein
LHKFAPAINRCRGQGNLPVVEGELKGGKTLEGNVGVPVHPKEVRGYGCCMEILAASED